MFPKQCQQCGTSFTALEANGKFCSLKCCGLSKRRAGYRGPRKIVIETKCVECGQPCRSNVELVKAGRGRCRKCFTRDAGRAARLKHPFTGERNVNWKGGITKDYPAWLSKWSKEYRAKNPLQQKARDAVGSAIRSGKLCRGPCELCGSTKSVQGHHQDYTKFLEVNWLCRTCHSRVHGKLGGLKEEQVAIANFVETTGRIGHGR